MPFRTFFAVMLAFLVGSGCADQASETPAAQSDQQDVSSTSPGTSSGTSQNTSSNTSSFNPAETVSRMLDAYLHERLGEYYQFVSAPDREVKSLDSLQAEFAPAAEDFVTDFLFSMTRFEVDSVHVNGDSARVYVTSRSPPIGYVMKEAHIIESNLGAETDMPTKLSVLTERHRIAGGPREEIQSVYRLVQEEKGWRVVVGWAELATFLDSEIEEREAGR